MVKYSADAVTEPWRQLIEERFGVVVLSGYNAVECLRIGFICDHGCGFRLREDLGHLRVIDGRGEQVQPGQSGEVVISNLVNHGTVLLNYRLGDVGVRLRAGPPCWWSERACRSSVPSAPPGTTPWSANPSGIPWPEMDAAFVTLGGANGGAPAA